MTKILRALLALTLALAAFHSRSILRLVESRITAQVSSEQTRTALDALFRYAAGPLAVVLGLFALTLLLAPWAISRASALLPEEGTRRSDRPFPVIILLCCLAFAVTLNRAAFRDYQITPDENTYLNQARIFARGHLWGKAPPLPESFEEPYLAHQDGRLFSIFQPGWSLLLAPGVRLGVASWTPPVTASLCLLVVFLLAARVEGPRAARIAAGILLTSPFFLFHAATYYSHMAEFLWISLFTLAFVTAEQEGRDRGYLLAGACLGAAFLTRYFDLFFGLPFGCLLLPDLFRRRPGAWKRLLLFVSPLAAALGLALLYQGLLTGDPFLAPYEVYVKESRYLYILPQLDDPLHFYGFSHAYPPSTALARAARRWASLNFWIFPLALPFLLPVILRPGKWHTLFLLGLASLTAIYIPYFLPGGWQYGPRYYFCGLGPLVVLIAVGLERTFRALRGDGWRRKAGRAVAWWLCLSAAFNLSVCILIGAGVRLVVRGATDMERLLAERGIRQGVVFITLHPAFLAHAGPRDRGKAEMLRRDIPYYLIRNRADYTRPLLFAHVLGDEQDARLMDRFPDRSFYLFRANPFAAAFGTGRGKLEYLGRGGDPATPLPSARLGAAPP